MPDSSPGSPIIGDLSTPRRVTRLGLLDMREQSWGPRLRSTSLVAEAEMRADHIRQVANALGHLYGRLADRQVAGSELLLRWPACVAATMAGAAVSGYEAGTYWRALWETVGYPGTVQDQSVWGQAFALGIERLGMATFPGMPLKYVGPILMHAGIPSYCLGDYFRLLLERRRRDPGMDAESFLSWATSHGRESRLFELDVPARRFISNGGEYAHDVVDRSLDLLERLSDTDPDLGGILLPAYMVDAARDEIQAGRLDPSPARRRTAAGQNRQPRPRIGLDPFGEGVRVILPAVGDAPDGVAVWRVTADGTVGTVQSRALWVGAAEAAPETTYPLPRPVRSVLVSLSSRDLTAELQVVEPADPILFFTDDGRQVPGSLSLPRGQAWILHPADRKLAFTGDADEVAEPPVPFGWEGWRLRLVSLDNVQAVSLSGGRCHTVHGQTRPRLLLNAPVCGIATPYGSPVYDDPPRLWLPGTTGATISWHVDVRPAAGGPSLLTLDIDGPSELDLGQHLPRPVIGAFDVTVRGPLGRGMRRTVFVADRLAVRYQPAVLTAGIYLVFAPWRPPVVLTVAADGIVTLPDELRDAGPVRILLQVEDPWTASSWPPWPQADSFSCYSQGIPASGDPEQDYLSRFISGDGVLPEHLDHSERLWQLVHLADDLIRSGARADLAQRCGEALRRQPCAALLSLLETGFDHQASIPALIVTGMAALRCGESAGVTTDWQADQLAGLTKAGQLWAALPTAAAILTGDLLPSANVQPDRPMAALAEDAIAQCGDTLRRMLRGENDPHASIGQFGPAAERMATLSPEQVEALWQAAAVVPHALLDADTRTVAARRAFDVRRRPAFRRAALDAASVLRTAEGLIRASRYTWLIRQVAARRHPDGKGGWLAVPAMSAALALVARLAARGDDVCRERERAWRELWVGLASRAPDLVGIDLVLAEALMAGADGARMRRGPNES